MPLITANNEESCPLTKAAARGPFGWFLPLKPCEVLFYKPRDEQRVKVAFCMPCMAVLGWMAWLSGYLFMVASRQEWPA